MSTAGALRRLAAEDRFEAEGGRTGRFQPAAAAEILEQPVDLAAQVVERMPSGGRRAGAASFLAAGVGAASFFGSVFTVHSCHHDVLRGCSTGSSSLGAASGRRFDAGQVRRAENFRHAQGARISLQSFAAGSGAREARASKRLVRSKERLRLAGAAGVLGLDPAGFGDHPMPHRPAMGPAPRSRSAGGSGPDVSKGRPRAPACAGAPAVGRGHTIPAPALVSAAWLLCRPGRPDLRPDGEQLPHHPVSLPPVVRRDLVRVDDAGGRGAAADSAGSQEEAIYDQQEDGIR